MLARRRPLRRAGLLPTGPLRTTVAALTAGALTAAWLSAPPPAHAAALRVKPAGKRRSEPTLDELRDRASAQAKKTGRPVTVDGLTTATSITMANPKGGYTLVQNPEPVRMRRTGAWVPLDATLKANPDKSLSPATVTGGLKLSGGGSGPLATLTDLGRSLSISWPTPLPAPSVSGATATYADVLPDVDLLVTATKQGGFSDVLVVKSRKAAQDPRLSSLQLSTVTTSGLTLTTTSSGGLVARAGHEDPSFTAPPPTMWDSATSAPPPTTSAGHGTPPPATRSTPFDPGTRAHFARMRTAVSPATAAPKTGTRHNALTITPDHDLLTSDSTVFPVYIDPSVGPKPRYFISVTNNGWDPRTDRLQVGYCGWASCGSPFVGRSFVRATISPQLKGATITSSTMQFPFAANTASGCTSAQVTRLWWSDYISGSTRWPGPGLNSWGSNGYIDAASSHWGADCTASQKAAGAEFDLTSFMKSEATGGKHATLSFALRASSESDTEGWRQYDSDYTMSTTYDHAPALPGHANTSPGGACTTNAAASVIGNDDVTFQVTPTDPDNDHLTTQFVLKDSAGTTVLDTNTGTLHSPYTASGDVARIKVTRAQLTAWENAAGGKTFTWYTRTHDTFSPAEYSPTTGLGSSGSPCAFTFDPTAPQQPDVQVPDDDVTFGQPATFTFAACTTVLDTPSQPCDNTTNPVRYSYQLNGGPSTRIMVTGASQTVQITSSHVGVNTLTLTTFSAAGNPSKADTETFTVFPPSAPYLDADFDGDGNPDVLTVGTTASKNPGLWLSLGDGAGAVGPPTDIGALGLGINSSPSPAEWTGTQVLHGDFTGNNVQDVIAYHPIGAPYPATGQLLYGNGNALPLNPTTSGAGHESLVVELMGDLDINDAANNYNGDYPTQLTAAGDADLSGSPVDELIGVAGDPDHGYELNLYTGSVIDGYSPTHLATSQQTPEPGVTWDKYALTTAQVNGQTVLFALDTSNGKLLESTNPDKDPQKIVGSSTSTWTTITGPSTTWATGSSLVSADVRPGASPTVELWMRNGLTLTPYTLTGTTLTAGTPTTLIAPAHSWPLTDGTAATTAVDASADSPATFSPTGINWTTDGNDTVHPVAPTFDGKSGYLRLPDNLIKGVGILTMSLRFQATPGTSGIILSSGNDTPDKANNAAMPIMYIGTDGHLYVQFWNGVVRPIISPQPVNDGQWHTVTLEGNTTTQSVYIDNNIRVGMAGSPQINNLDPQVYVGAGVFPINTTTKAFMNTPGDATKTRPSYFSGRIADVAFYSQNLATNHLGTLNIPSKMTGSITSTIKGANGNLCVDDPNNQQTAGDHVQIYTCNNTKAQQWSINTDGTITSAGGLCLAVSGAHTDNDTPVILWTCNNGPEQQWHLDSVGEIWNPNAKRCLDDPGGSTTLKTQLQIYDCNYRDTQNWMAP
ncbi:ricin-type beta-trefoil lectin domain protein [Actinomadura violacea]|uniref:Ricin-type beta-trefoil lectin domain protein n=1 Tax=Actinomadura violacea TaxID=2819934 RepID=A0ABS3RU74_9ACTN|nr:ricin-type beta-trefoil lectin domain protein [Actinomadura violacea]MBO2460310.1 ricin-type beta-trefoil lectin domain protein [Actinomadura violacea]